MNTTKLNVKETPTSEELGISRGEILDIYLGIKSQISKTISEDKNKLKELNVTRKASDKNLISGGASKKVIGEQSVLFPTKEQETEIEEQGYSLRDRVLDYIKSYNKSNNIKLKICENDFKKDLIKKSLIGFKLNNIKGSNKIIIEVLEADNKIFFVCSNEDNSTFGIY